MARLIAAELLKSDCNITGGFSDNFVVMDLETLGREIDRQPTVDAVEVVRCKDCIYYKESDLLAPNKFCYRLKHPAEDRHVGYNFSDDDYCSYGAKMDGGDKE